MITTSAIPPNKEIEIKTQLAYLSALNTSLKASITETKRYMYSIRKFLSTIDLLRLKSR